MEIVSLVTATKQPFFIHFDKDGYRAVSGAVYGAYLSSEEGKYYYQVWEDGAPISPEEIKEQKPRKMFGFYYSPCSGDERLYFKDDEYWGHELQQMSDLWNILKPYLDQWIRKNLDKNFEII